MGAVGLGEGQDRLQQGSGQAKHKRVGKQRNASKVKGLSEGAGYTSNADGGCIDSAGGDCNDNAHTAAWVGGCTCNAAGGCPDSAEVAKYGGLALGPRVPGL